MTLDTARAEERPTSDAAHDASRRAASLGPSPAKPNPTAPSRRNGGAPYDDKRALIRAILPSLAFAALACAVPLLRRSFSEAWASALWGLVLVASFVGWGSLVNYLLRPGARRDWGLDGALGAAAFLWMGSVLSIGRLIHPVTIWVLVLSGFAAYAYVRLRDRAPPISSPVTAGGAVYRFAFAMAVGIAMLEYAESVVNASFNVFDDNMAYRGIARKLLETGAMYEPFSSHRLASFGGQTMLHAAMLAGAPGERLHVVDSGICVLLTLGLIAGHGANPLRRGATLLAAILLVTMPHPRHNLASEMSGVVFFLAFFRLFDDARMDAERPLGNAVAVGLLAAAASSLRQNYLGAAAVTVAAFYLFRLFATSRAARRQLWKEVAFVAGASLAALLPWMILSYINGRTFLYPIMPGNSNPGWGLLGKVSVWEEGRWFLVNIFYFEPIKTIAFLVVAGCLLPSARATVAARAQLVGALIGFCLTVHAFQASVYFDSVGRYYYSFVGAFALAITLGAVSDTAASTTRLVPAIIAICSVVLHVHETRANVSKTYAMWWDGARLLFQSRIHENNRPPDPLTDFYQRMQNVTPAGERLLVMADHTFLYDYKRNEIYNFDQPGATSPPPHVPYFKGPEAFAQYFQDVGIRYVNFIVGNSSFEYQYPMWRQRAAQVIAPGQRGGMYHDQAPWNLDAFDNFMALTTTRKVLFHEGDYWVLDLATPS
jgi:hypothetical protein